MRILGFILIVAAVFLTGCQIVTGSGNVKREDREVAGFEGVALHGIGDLTLVQTEEQSVIIEAEDNLLPLIETDVRNGILHIGFKNQPIQVRNTKPIKYFVSTSNIDQISVSGSGSAMSESIESDELFLRVSGSGDIAVNEVNVDDLDVKISGSGDIELQGEAKSQNISVSGSGNYDAPNLMGEDVTVKVSGSGQAGVWATDNLFVNVTGSGHVNFQGEPELDYSISGSGNVTKIAGR